MGDIMYDCQEYDCAVQWLETLTGESQKLPEQSFQNPLQNALNPLIRTNDLLGYGMALVASLCC